MADSADQIALPLLEPNMLETAPAQPRRTNVGRSSVSYTPAKSILTEPTGFISHYDYTLNPYSGCTFGCTYCYAAFFVPDAAKQESWGQWVTVKENALALLKRKRANSLRGKTIYMSSVTDPYQPIELDLELTRSILQELITYHQPKLVVQTRSPIVTRDIDLLQQFEQVRVNMTVTTDDEAIRKVFEPNCASIPARLNAITKIHQANIPACITLSPLLPVKDAATFAKRLVETGIPKIVVRPFHPDRGKFVAGTRDAAKGLLKERNWNATTYEAVVAVLKAHIPNIEVGREGFAPD